MVHVELARGARLEPDVLVLERLAAARLAAVVVLYDLFLFFFAQDIIIYVDSRAPRVVEPALHSIMGHRVVICV